MEDRTFLTNNHPTDGISDTFREFIEALVEEVVINGEPFDAQKKWLRKYSEAEGVCYETMESNLSDLFEALKELEEHESRVVERSVRFLAEECYLSETMVNKLIDNAAAVRTQKEAVRKAQEEKERKAREEAERKAREDDERKAREERDRIAKEKAQLQEKLDAERKAKEEAERIALAEKQAREEAERKAKEDAERKAREDMERKAKEEEERRRRERERKEAEQREKERLEADRKAREEAERRAREERERKAREEAERNAKASSEINRFFPSDGVILGKTTVCDLPYLLDHGQLPDGKRSYLISSNSQTTLICDSHGNIESFTKYKGDDLPAKWTSLGFNWELSCNQCLCLLRRLGFYIKEIQKPICENPYGKVYYFHAAVEAKSPSGIMSIDIGFDANYEASADSPNTLWYISIRYLG